MVTWCRRWHQIVVIVRIVFHRVIGTVASADRSVRTVEVLVELAAHSSLPPFRLLPLQRLRLQGDHASLGQDDVVDDVVGVGERRYAGELRRARRRTRVGQFLAGLKGLLNNVRRLDVGRPTERTRVSGHGALLGILLVHYAVALAVAPALTKEVNLIHIEFQIIFNSLTTAELYERTSRCANRFFNFRYKASRLNF
jgi:hypothetical protein